MLSFLLSIVVCYYERFSAFSDDGFVETDGLFEIWMQWEGHLIPCRIVRDGEATPRASRTI